MKKLLSVLLCIAILCTIGLPAMAEEGEVVKLETVDFMPGSASSTTYITLEAALGEYGDTFTLDSSHPITVTARNGALIQEVHLTNYVAGQTKTKNGVARLAVAAFALYSIIIDVPSTTGQEAPPAQTVSANQGQAAEVEGGYAVTGVNADSVTVSATDFHALSSITVVYSLNPTKEDIKNAINEKGEAFKQAISQYKEAKRVFDAADGTYREAENAHKQAEEDYGLATEAWKQAESDFQPALDSWKAAQNAFQPCLDSYTPVRNNYLALRAKAIALGLDGADSLPDESKDLAALYDSSVTLPVPMTERKATFTPTAVQNGEKNEDLKIAASSNGTSIKIRAKASSVTIENTAGGTLKTVTLESQSAAMPPPFTGQLLYHQR